MTETSRASDPRLDALRATDLLDSPAERAFDRLTRLAAGLLGAPTALVSLVDEHRQFFKSAFGLNDPWASKRETPLSHSFCQYVTQDRKALIISDARDDERLKDNGAIPDIGVIAYAGIPLMVNGEAIGSFCVIDAKPRVWKPEETQLLSDLAESVVAEIELRIALRSGLEQRMLQQTLINSIADGLLAIDPNGTVLIANQRAQEIFGPSVAPGAALQIGTYADRRLLRPDGTEMLPEQTPIARGLRGKDTDGLEFMIEATDGRGATRWIEATGRPVRKPDVGEREPAMAAVGVYRDVTEKKQRTDLYKTVVQQIPRGSVSIFDRKLRCISVDGGLRRGDSSIPKLAGKVGDTMRDLMGAALDPAFDPIEAAFKRALAGESESLDYAYQQHILALHVAPVFDAAKRITGGIVLAIDVTRERATASALRHSEELYRAIVQNLPDAAVLMVDRDLRYVAADGPLLRSVLENAQLDTMVGRLVAEVSSEANRDHLLDIYRSALQGTAHQLEVFRGARWYDMNVIPLFDGDEPTHVLVFLHDVTKRKAELAELERTRVILEQQARELQEASTTDELTGLLNRRGFVLIAEQEMKVATRNNSKMVLFFADLNGMKAINDNLGHKMGDRALIETAGILRRVFRSSDVLARLGGDEFVVLATDAVETSGPTFTARMEEALAEYNAASPPFVLSLSVGNAVYDPAKPSTLQGMLSEADTKMYAAKTERKESLSRVKLS